jgi:hypothetical protein
MILMTATPVHLGNQNLFHLLRILDPDEFQEPLAFERRLRSNEPIVLTQRLLGQRPLDMQKALEALRGAESTEEASRFLENPIYQDLLGRLRASKTLDHSTMIESQRDLASLNLLGHVLTRTRKSKLLFRSDSFLHGVVLRILWKQHRIIRVNFYSTPDGQLPARNDQALPR